MQLDAPRVFMDANFSFHEESFPEWFLNKNKDY